MKAEKAIQVLGSLMRSRKCVPFCGAGVSVASGLPTASEFLDRFDLQSLPWDNASEILRARPAFYQEMVRLFGDPTLSPNEQHRYVALLDPPYVITTNYDLLFEKAFTEVYGATTEDRLCTIRKSSHLPKISHYRNVLIKLHGDIDDVLSEAELLVVSRRQYTARLTHPTIIDHFVKCLCSTYSIFFLGYSLSDSNVNEMLDYRQNITTRYLPESYALLFEGDRHKEAHFQSLGVTPVYLPQTDKRHIAVAEFLHRLWEQGCSHAEFVWFQNPELTTRDLLTAALRHKQRGDVTQAQQALDQVQQLGIDWTGQGSLAETYLYLSVSVRDKLEAWDELRVLENSLFIGILKGLQNVVPQHVYGTIISVYQGSMALAAVRAGDFDNALTRLDEALKYPPTDTAGAELHIQFANLIVTKAMARLGLALKSNAAVNLREAQESISSAEAYLNSHRVANDAHHFGRFYGTRAFVEAAALSDVVTQAQKANILEDARKSHEGHRTGFGRTSGLYCDAYCHYRIGCVTKDDREKMGLLAEATELLRRAKQSIEGDRQLPKLKITILEDQIARQQGQALGRVLAWDKEAEGFLTRFPNILALVNKLEWLGMPLN